MSTAFLPAVPYNCSIYYCAIFVSLENVFQLHFALLLFDTWTSVNSYENTMHIAVALWKNMYLVSWYCTNISRFKTYCWIFQFYFVCIFFHWQCNLTTTFSRIIAVIFRPTFHLPLFFNANAHTIYESAFFTFCRFIFILSPKLIDSGHFWYFFFAHSSLLCSDFIPASNYPAIKQAVRFVHFYW